TEKGTDAPVEIRLEKKEKWTFSVIDQGTGIDQNIVDTILTKYGKSTRRSSNDFIGAKGLGSKAGFSYENNYFTITGRKNGVESQWLFSEDANNFVSSLIYTTKTSEPDGATFSLDLIDNDYEARYWNEA